VDNFGSRPQIHHTVATRRVLAHSTLTNRRSAAWVSPSFMCWSVFHNAVLSLLKELMKSSKNTSASKPYASLVAPQHKTLPELPSALVANYSAAAQSNATTRSYDADIRHFKQYGGMIPATPTVVAEYLACLAGTLAVATLQHRLIAIHRAHTDCGLPSPVINNLVKRTMQGIRRTLGTRQRRVMALVKDDLLEMMVHVDQQMPMRAARDKALILVGFAGAFRRSELVGLQYEDMTQYDSGVELLLRRSKTDQEGAGRIVFIPYARGIRCPVKVLKSWLALAGIDSGPLFRPINRHDRVVGCKALTPQSVALIVKACMRMVGGDEAAKMVAGHSLRAGYCTEAATVGMQPHLIRETTGHRSDVTLARYIRPVAKRKVPSLL
jgi:site-specific recombinase XerD